MCGIAGIVSSDRPDARLVRCMCDQIVHRGPDGSGFHDDDQAVLGMRRLAIIDVAGSQQPVYNEDRTVAAVFNGEIYNFGDLRAQLRARGHVLTTNGDSECLVHLYEDYGDDLVHHLRGMFAFAIWDAANRRLLLGRDRVGKKPLYWRDERHVAVLRVGTQSTRRGSGRPAPGRPGSTAPLPHLPIRPSTMVYLRRNPEAAAWTRAELAGRRHQGQPLLAHRLHRAFRHVHS